MKEKKKPYSAPRLRVIALETKEVMATICKTGGADMNVGNPSCGFAEGCVDTGS